MVSLTRKSVSLLFLITCLNAPAADPLRPSSGAGEAGMGYACIMRNTFWSSFHNQAALAFNRSVAAGISYENRFGIAELGTRTAALAVPAGKASIGAIYNCFGYSDFMRHTAGLACGLALSDKIAAGVQADYFLEKSSGEYDSHDAITFEAGLMVAASEKVTIGVHLFNPVPGTWRKTSLPSRLRAGAGILLTEDLFAGAEAGMSTAGSMVVRTGFDYRAVKNLQVRGGFSSEYTSFSFGLGYRVGSVQLDLGFRSHQKLGITSSASILLVIK